MTLPRQVHHPLFEEPEQTVRTLHSPLVRATNHSEVQTLGKSAGTALAWMPTFNSLWDNLLRTTLRNCA
jgi:hypothetical protein